MFSLYLSGVMLELNDDKIPRFSIPLFNLSNNIFGVSGAEILENGISVLSKIEITGAGRGVITFISETKVNDSVSKLHLENEGRDTSINLPLITLSVPSFKLRKLFNSTNELIH